jgi:uncharacterized tellurite resistance protein B-like protein
MIVTLRESYMHKALMKLLGFENAEVDAPDTADTETVRKLVAELDHLEPDRARYVASFAYVLSRVARADLEISGDETRVMERIVTEIGHMPPEQAVIVVQMAKTQNQLFGGTENYLVVREFNAMASREQKLDLLRCLFAVSAADEHVSTAESNVVSQIAEELLLSHDDFIAVRTEFRDYLGVFKKPEAD